MGVIGAQIGALLGKAGERAIGKLYEYKRPKIHPVGQGILDTLGSRLKGSGEGIGSSIGSLLPFKKGGRIKKNGKIYAHKGEFILPKGVKPTTHQLRIVRKKHRKKK